MYNQDYRVDRRVSLNYLIGRTFRVYLRTAEEIEVYGYYSDGSYGPWADVQIHKDIVQYFWTRESAEAYKEHLRKTNLVPFRGG